MIMALKKAGGFIILMFDNLPFIIFAALATAGSVGSKSSDSNISFIAVLQID